jgi:hypothetical protein
MNRANPIFSDEDISRIAGSLPASSKPERVQALGTILREWSRTDLPDHLSRGSLASKWKQSSEKLMKVERYARKLLQEIEALDDYSRFRIRHAMESVDQQQPSSTGRAGEDQAQIRVDDELAFLRTLSTLTSKAKRGQPRNISAYLVMLDAAAIYEWASGKKATRNVDRQTYKEVGPFRKFLEALWPVVFGNGTHGLQAAMRRWEEAHTKYDEKSAVISNIRSNIRMRARAGRLTSL